MVKVTLFAAPAALAMGVALGAQPAIGQTTEPAQAQSAPQPPPQAGGGLVQEVIVTAQRRSERLQDVPASITAVSQQTLSKAGITNTSELAKAVPGLALPFYGNFLQPSIRGVTSTGANVGESSNVALYIDGVYQPQQIATLFSLPDVEQVEVLKGPQGALYGQDATGGAILVNSRSPSFTPSGMASISYGDYDDILMRGYATGAIANGIAASIAGGYETRDGYRTQVATGQRDFGLDSKLFRGKLLAEPAPFAKITFTGYYSFYRSSDQNDGYAYDNNSIGYFFVPNAPKVTSSSQYGASPDVFTQIKASGGNLRGEFNTGVGVVTTITALERNVVTYDTDVDASPVNFAIAYTGPLTGQYLTQEANFASKAFGPFSFLAGAFYLDGGDTFHNNGFEIFVPSVLPAPAVPSFNLMSYQRLDKQIVAGYGEITWKVLPKLVVTAGGRYTEEKLRGFNNFGGTSVGNSGQIYEYPGDPVSFSKFTPRVTARYAITDRANVYASWGQGFKSGNINLSGEVPPGVPGTTFDLPPVQPETITAYEAGFKGRVLDTLQADASIFYYDYKNLQLVQYNPPNYIEQNAAGAYIKGVDFDLTWRATHEFTLSGGGTYTDSEYSKGSFASGFEPTTPTAANGYSINAEPTISLAGDQLIRAPRFTGNLTADYEHDVALGHFGAYVSGYYNSGFPFEVTDRIRQKSYATMDTELSFTPATARNFRFVVWGKNLTDSVYLASVLQSQYGDSAVNAPPRTFGVRGEFKY